MQENRRLNILFLPALYPSAKDPVRGIFVRGHAKAASLHNEIVVLYSEGMDNTIGNLYTWTDLREDNIRTIRIRYKKSPIPKTTCFIVLWSIFATFRNLVKEGFRPDIIHAHIFSAGMPAVILGKLYKIPVIITEHYSGFPRHILTFSERIRARFAMNRAQIILPVSNALKEAIETYNIKNKFRIVPNVVNIDKFHPLSSQDRRSANEVKRLLLVAILTPLKGIPYLLEALSQIRHKRRDFSLDIVGDGPNRKEYEELARKLGLEQIVRFQGFKPEEEVTEFMRNCDFYVQPSLFETFGVVYIEAMACGKPIIASECIGSKEMINTDVGVLVPPKDVKALREAIEYMLDNYQNYSSGKIAQYARERFSYEAVGMMLNELYSEVKEEACQE